MEKVSEGNLDAGLKIDLMTKLRAYQIFNRMIQDLKNITKPT